MALLGASILYHKLVPATKGDPSCFTSPCTISTTGRCLHPLKTTSINIFSDYSDDECNTTSTHRESCRFEMFAVQQGILRGLTGNSLRGSFHIPASRSLFTRAKPAPRSPIRTGLYTTVFALSAGLFAVYYFDARSALHRYVLTPVLRYAFDAETGHKLAVKVLRSGLGPRDPVSDDSRLKSEVRRTLCIGRFVLTRYVSFGVRKYPTPWVWLLGSTRMGKLLMVRLGIYFSTTHS